MPPMKIAITGITGRFGSLVAEKLLSGHDPEIEIHGISRRGSKVSSSITSDRRVTLFAVDPYDSEQLHKGLEDTSVCICCYGGDIKALNDGQKALIDACIACGVGRYIAADFSSDFRLLKQGDFPFKDFQLEIHDYLSRQQEHITGVHILNGGFMEALTSPFMNIIDSDTDTFRYWGTGDELWDMTSVNDVAGFVAKVARDQSDSAKGFLTVRGDRKSIKEMSKLYEEVYRRTVSLSCLGSLDDLEETMTRRREAEPNNPYGWLGLHFHYFTLNGSTLLPSDVGNRYSTLKPMAFQQLLETRSKGELRKLYERN